MDSVRCALTVIFVENGLRDGNRLGQRQAHIVVLREMVHAVGAGPETIEDIRAPLVQVHLAHNELAAASPKRLKRAMDCGERVLTRAAAG